MEQQKGTYEKIMESVKTIFSFALSRTTNREEADDLSQEIIKELLKSAASLRDEKAFYGWMWAVANNVYKCHLRKAKRQDYTELDENLYASYEMPDSTIIKSEELSLLRRELSLLSTQYRRAMIMYYIESKSCSSISEELCVSIEMVKYLLFKARKKLKEGIGMSRKYGGKSYNPDIFNMNFWGNGPSKDYWDLFKRRLPGNILLAAYYSPLTLEELSIELGVSGPYLEDEIEILMKHNLIKMYQNGRYQCNIVIFTEGCEEDIYAKTKDIYSNIADKVNEFITMNENKIKQIGFYGANFSKNRFSWLAAHFALWHGMLLADSNFFQNRPGYPLLSNGSHGYIWGLNMSFEKCHFNGIYGRNFVEPNSDWTHICNYKIIEKCQHLKYRDIDTKLLIAAAKNQIIDKDDENLARLIAKGFILHNNDTFKVNLPVFTETQYNSMLELYKPIISEVAEDIKTAVTIAAKILADHAPSKLKGQCETIAQIKHQMDVIGLSVEQMCYQGYLLVPNSAENLVMYIVLK